MSIKLLRQLFAEQIVEKFKKTGIIQKNLSVTQAFLLKQQLLFQSLVCPCNNHIPDKHGEI